MPLAVDDPRLQPFLRDAAFASRPRRAVETSLRLLAVALDIATVFLAYYGCYLLVFSPAMLAKQVVVPWLISPVVPGVLSLLVVFWMQYTRGYQDRRFIADRGDWPGVAKAVLLSVGAALALGFFLEVALFRYVSRTFIVLASVAMAAGLFGNRLLLHAVRARLRRRGIDIRRVLVIGTGQPGRQIAAYMARHPDSGLHCVGVLGERRSHAQAFIAPRPAVRPELEFLFEPDSGDRQNMELSRGSRLHRAVRRLRADEVIIAWPSAELGQLVTLILHLDRLGVRVRVLHPTFHLLSERLPLRFELFHGVPIVDLNPFSGGCVHRITKRLFDYTFSLAVVVLGGPMWLAIALVIWLHDHKAVLYRQPRVGTGGRVFDLFKFRTMVSDADARLAEVRHLNMMDGPMFKAVDDPRVTPVGRWLRRFSLDEVPQFLNVLRGEISVVGARPPRVHEVLEYYPWHAVRLRRWMGITGLWQICGRNEVSFDEVVLFDLFYNRNSNTFLDLLIIGRTVGVMLSGKGA